MGGLPKMGGCLTFLRTMRCFVSVLSHVFCLESHEKVEDLCDKVRNWWKLYRCETEKNVSTNKEIENRTNKRLKQVRLVTGRMLSKLLIFWYWKKIGTIKKDSGQLKYPQLFSLLYLCSVLVTGIVFQRKCSLLKSIYLTYTETPPKVTQS